MNAQAKQTRHQPEGKVGQLKTYLIRAIFEDGSMNSRFFNAYSEDEALENASRPESWWGEEPERVFVVVKY